MVAKLSNIAQAKKPDMTESEQLQAIDKANAGLDAIKAAARAKRRPPKMKEGRRTGERQPADGLSGGAVAEG